LTVGGHVLSYWVIKGEVSPVTKKQNCGRGKAFGARGHSKGRTLIGSWPIEFALSGASKVQKLTPEKEGRDYPWSFN
jgi:hypothetical protein